jgi:hypothetical protein
MESFFFGILGGFIAWTMTWFFVQPLSVFFNLRGQAAEVLARYEGRSDPNPDAPPLSQDWITERKRAYESCGAALEGFSASNSVISALLYRPRPIIPRYYVRSAGSSLLTLSEVKPGTAAASELRDNIRSALKLGDGISRKRRH